MQTKTDSFSFYRHLCQNNNPNFQNVQKLLDLMVEELVVVGHSNLIDAFFNSVDSLYKRYQKRHNFSPAHYTINEIRVQGISLYDSYFLLSFLSEYLKKATFTYGNEPLFQGHTIDLKYCKSILLFLQEIDDCIIPLRKKIYQGFFSNNRPVVVKETVNSPARSEELPNMEKYFSDIRKTLVDVNQTMHLLENSLSQGVTQKIYSRLIELYNLIADNRDSIKFLVSQKKDNDYINIYDNLNVFLDMIIGYLSDFGIQTLASKPGESFSPKHHAVKNSSTQLDCHRAVVKKSLRNGFIWGEQVLQKELIEI